VHCYAEKSCFNILIALPLLLTALQLFASNTFTILLGMDISKKLSIRRSTSLHRCSWRNALFEYLLQVPANRIGYTARSLTGAAFLIFKA